MDLLVVGWDGATKSHLEEFSVDFWENADHKGNLVPEEPFLSSSYISSANAWTTILTGASFEQHNILGFVYGKHQDTLFGRGIKSLSRSRLLPRFFRRLLISEGLGRFSTDTGRVKKHDHHIQSTDVKYSRIWELLAGKSLIFGVPITYPALEMEGALVSGIPAPRPEDSSQPLVHPPELFYEAYGHDFNGYYVESESPVFNDKVSEIEYSEEHLNKSENIVDSFLRTYNTMEESGDDVSFGFLMLRSLDDICHATDDLNIIENAYERMDMLTSILIDEINPDDVLILSDHGMRNTSALRIDNDLKMDHDTTSGIWASTADLGLNTQLDVTPSILNYYQINEEVPKIREQIEVSIQKDNNEVHERLEDLGYA